MLNGFTLVGDSQLRRFYCSLNKHYRTHYEAYCFSGITIAELKQKLKEIGYISNRIILLIGTNDLLRFASEENLKRDYLALVKFVLRSVGWNGRVILVTVPAIPRLANNPEFWKRLVLLNRLVRSFASNPKVTIVDVKTYEGREILRPRTYGKPLNPPAEFFEKTFFDGRPDNIHGNQYYFRDLYAKLAEAFESIRFED